MKPMTMVLMMLLGIGMAAWGVSGAGDEPPNPTAIADKPVAAAESEAEPEAGPDAQPEPDPDKERGFKLPPGFKEKKRGKFVLYCKHEASMGTRVKSETCFDEKQMRDYLLALETGKVDIDRTRAVCSNPCICGMPC